MHLVKGYVGTGVFSMGDALKNSGLIFGPITILLIGMVCLHCCHLLVNSAYLLNTHFKFERVPDYADTAKLSFALVAPDFPALGFVAKLIVNAFLIMAQMGFCACYFVFISWNVRELLKVYKCPLDIHWIIAIVVIPIWLTCLIRTLKLLAKISMLANIILLTSIVIVLYYSFTKPTSHYPAGLMIPSISKFAIFFGQSVYAFEGIGLVLILYNEMSSPELFNETYGVLNIGLHIVTILYLCFGVVTYVQFGDAIKETVTLNLDTKEILGQTVLVLISIGVSFSFSLQLYVAIDIICPKILLWLGPFEYPVLVELWLRTALVITTFVMAEAIPRLQIMLSFVGSFLSCALIVIFPAIIDITTSYSFKKLTKCLLLKDFLIVIFGIIGMLAGTYESLALLANEIGK
ncbi:unnamed protein product [Ceutorhynchus assimilis]|uniref:Amino acid transporter transmembrane domain-containing protein n=1 Tax=Ceutorhynchus assimilis TaxID=467358 RepID=A0A9P0DGQ1_9CUCU|nr:unnamed protein product [Ceutorhynchus assimilis]